MISGGRRARCRPTGRGTARLARLAARHGPDPAWHRDTDVHLRVRLGEAPKGRDLGGRDDGGRTGVGVHGPSGTRPGDECEITLLMVVHLLQGGLLRRAGERFQTPASPARRVTSLLRRFLLGLGLPARRPILAHPLGYGPALLLAHRALAPADRLTCWSGASSRTSGSSRTWAPFSPAAIPLPHSRAAPWESTRAWPLQTSWAAIRTWCSTPTA